jgi:bilirubin oxidase
MVGRGRAWVVAGALCAFGSACGDDGGPGGAGGSGAGATTSTTTTTGTGGSASAYNPLWIPEAIAGTTFDLTLAESSKRFFGGSDTPTIAFNGAEFWGPTLIMNQGDLVQLNVTNGLGEDTTTHWHGMHVPAAVDGGPHQVIDAGTTWSPSFQVMNEAATYWYHPHLHMETKRQLTLGAGGFIIVQDAEEAALRLPRTYGVDDVPLALTSRRFQGDDTFDDSPAYGDYLLTNGVMHAEASLPAQVVRLRILNAEIMRAYDLGFSDDRTFWVIATDGGLVQAPVPVTRVPLFTGERVEILVDLSADAVGSSLDLRSFNGGKPFGYPGGEPATTGQFGSLLNDTTFDVLHIEVGAATAGAVTTIPASLVSDTYWTDADATNTRTLSITDLGPGTPFTFDGVAYDPSVINQNVALGAVEKWTIQNGATFSHAFHIHDVQFNIVSRSSGPVGAWETGWKDTLSIAPNESVSFVARFADFASPTDPYMYHCHMANHEDEGTMGQFLVQ